MAQQSGSAVVAQPKPSVSDLRCLAEQPANVPIPVFSRADSGLNRSSTIYRVDGKVIAVGLGLAGDLPAIGFRSQSNSSVNLWDLAVGSSHNCFLEFAAGAMNLVTFGPDVKLLAGSTSTDYGSAIYLWQVSTGKLLYSLRDSHSGVSSMTISPDGKMLAIAYGTNLITLWNINTGQLLLNIRSRWGSVNQVIFTPDSRFLVATDSESGRIAFWDASTGIEARTFDAACAAIAFRTDDQLLACAGIFETKLLDPSNGSVARILEKHQNTGSPTGGAVAFSPDGQLLASSYYYMIKLWDLTSGSLLMNLTGHTGSIDSLMFSSDGIMLVSSSEDNTVRLWDLSYLRAK